MRHIEGSCFFSGPSNHEVVMVDYRDLATVKQVAAEAPFITEATLRWWIFHAETN